MIAWLRCHVRRLWPRNSEPRARLTVCELLRIALTARPVPRLRFPSSAHKSDLAGLAFTNLPEAVSPPPPDRDLGLLLLFNSSNGEDPDKKLVTYQICMRRVELSDAFAGLGSPTLPAKKIDMSGHAKTEWVRQRLLRRQMLRDAERAVIDCEALEREYYPERGLWCSRCHLL